MILEKIKEHSGKISFFAINVLLIAIGAMYIKQRSLQNSLDNLSAQQTATLEAAVADSASLNTQALQDSIIGDRQQKIDSIVNNPATVSGQQNVAVTKTIPATIKTVTNAGSTSSTVQKATPTAPTKTTKTS